MFGGGDFFELQRPLRSFLLLWRSGQAMSFERVHEGGTELCPDRDCVRTMVVDVARVFGDSGYRLFDRSPSKLEETTLITAEPIPDTRFTLAPDHFNSHEICLGIECAHLCLCPWVL